MMKKQLNQLTDIGKLWLVSAILTLILIVVVGINLLIQVNTVKPFLSWNIFANTLGSIGLLVLIQLLFTYVARKDILKK